MRTKNPIFSNIELEHDSVYSDASSYGGVTKKTTFLLVLSILSAILTGFMIFNIKDQNSFVALLIVSSILGFISVLIGRNNANLSKYFAAIYAVCQGIFLGTITIFGELLYPGIGVIAAISTVAVFGVMLALFATGVIRNTRKLYSIALTMGISLISITILLMIGNIFFPSIASLVTENFGLVLVLELFFLAYGAIMLLVNFTEVTYYVKNGFDRKYEWVAAFGLLVSILYIYIEIIRILILIFGRRD